MHILAELLPLDPVVVNQGITIGGDRITIGGNVVTLPRPWTQARRMIRVSSAQDRAITGLGGLRWWPGMARKPSLGIALFDGDFSSPVDPGSASMDIQMDAMERMDADVGRFVWAGAPVTLYAGRSGDAWPWNVVFSGRVSRFQIEGSKLSLTASVDTEPFDAKLLATDYMGTSGIEGGPDVKNRPKPWAFGAPRNVEPVLINAADSIYQVSAYGPIKAVDALYERGSAFGSSYGDYGSYGALAIAAIPEGRWATCLAQGLIRLGAPPYGVITADVQGDYYGAIWRRRPGEILNRIASALAIDGARIDASSLAALDAVVSALPGGGNVSLYLTEQESFIDFARRMVLGCNAQAGIGWTGKLFATRPAFATPIARLHAQGRALPPVTGAVEADVSPPYKRMQMSGAKCWRVHSFDEIAFGAELIDRGQYVASEVYREGNIVALSDGSKWLFVGTTPLAGSAPSDANANWSRMSDRVVAVDGSGTPLETLIAAIASDAVLSRGEKPQLIREREALLANYNVLVAKSTSLGVAAAERVAATAAINALNGYLTSLTPAWNDSAADTSIVAATFLTRWSDAYEAVADLQAAIQGLVGPAGDDGLVKQFVWKRSAGAPAAPVGDGVPAGWGDEPPGGAGLLWMSTATQKLDGTTIGTWSSPVVTTGDPGPPGNDGSDGDDGAPAIGFVQDATPGSGAFVSQTWYRPGFKEWYRWDGASWLRILGDLATKDLIADSAYLADAVIISSKIGFLQVKDANIDNLTVGTSKVAANAITRSFYVQSNTLINFPSGIYTTWMGITVTKQEASSLLEVAAQLEFFANDAIDCFVYVDINQAGSPVTRRLTQIALDGNNATIYPVKFDPVFNSLPAGAYDVYVAVQRTTANTCRSNGTSHLKVTEIMR